MGVWQNGTNELGFNGKILQSITDWLQESKHITLTGSKDDADLILSGSIDSIDYPATAFSSTDRATTLKAKVNTSYVLLWAKTGETLSQTQNTVREASYSIGYDAVRTQSNRRAALSEVASRIGEQIYLEVFYAITGYKK